MKWEPGNAWPLMRKTNAYFRSLSWMVSAGACLRSRRGVCSCLDPGSNAGPFKGMNDYRQITEAFQENFRNYGELGASVSVWQEGREIVSLHSGFAAADETRPWTEHSLVPVYSATKGAASAALLLALHQQGATPQMSMGELWPEFPLPYASIAQMMSHQCGLAAFSRTANVFDHEDCARALEETVPAWQPPEHGYHPHTYGVMLDELMLRLTGERLWRYWEEYIRKPLNLDFYIRLPESEWNRVATLYPGKMDMSNMGTPFYLEYMNKGTPVHRAFNTLIGLNSVRQMNVPEAWSSGAPAFGGVASARGMAQFYQACLGLDELRVFPSAVRNVVIDGPDLTLKTPTAFSCGFMHDPADPATGRKLRHLFGSGGFGHAGAGGSHAFADPAYGLSFGYAMNRMDLNVLPGVKTRNLISAVMKEVAEECS